MIEKVIDYLAAGLMQIHIVDPRAKSITFFAVGIVPVTYRGDRVKFEVSLISLIVDVQ